MPKIISRKAITTGFLKLFQLEIQKDEHIYHYEFLDKKSASAVLVLNTETRSVILVEQWRPINNGTITLECVAGLIDEGETPISTAIKEVYEEVGYKITEADLKFCGEKMVSPGTMNETYHLYIACVTNAMQHTAGGGLITEHEQINVKSYPVATFLDMDIADLKTAYLQLFIHKHL